MNKFFTQLTDIIVNNTRNLAKLDLGPVYVTHISNNEKLWKSVLVRIKKKLFILKTFRLDKIKIQKRVQLLQVRLRIR